MSVCRSADVDDKIDRCYGDGWFGVLILDKYRRVRLVAEKSAQIVEDVEQE